MFPGGWFGRGPRADKTTLTPSIAVVSLSMSVSSPLMSVMEDGLFWRMSSGIFSGDLAKMTMLASGYSWRVLRRMRMPLAPVAPRMRKRMDGQGQTVGMLPPSY